MRRFRNYIVGQQTVSRLANAMLWLLVIICQTLSASACAKETRVALVVGVSNYLHAPHLPNTLNDAREVSSKLQHLGFDVDTVIDPDRLKLENAIRNFGQNARGADAALFFYAGHALELGGRNWLIPVQASLQSELDLRFEALDLDAVVEQMEAQARVSMLILDACRDNPFRRLLVSGSRSESVGRGLAPQRAATGTLIVYSTALGDVAADGSGPNSPFTTALLRHMETPGIDVRQLIAEVRHDVREATGGQQVPWESSALEGQFFLNPAPVPTPAPAPAPTPPAGPAVGPLPGVRDAEVVLWDSVKDTSDPADLQLYLSRFPGGMFAPLARNRIAMVSRKVALPPEHQTPPSRSVSLPGASYQGAYFCGRHTARLTLNVFPQGGESVRRAMFSFGPEPTSPDVPRGAFVVEGSIDLHGGEITLTPVKWVLQPPGYRWLGLTGRSDDGGKTFSGRVVDNNACTVFTLRRIGDSTASK